MISGGSPTRTPSRSRDRVRGRDPPPMQELPDELERRLQALSDESAQGADFDPASWFWLLLLGLAGPIALIIAGWRACAGSPGRGARRRRTPAAGRFCGR